MMVGAPDIDQFVIVARVLVAMIGDVAGEIGQLAVALDDRAVLIIAELRRSIPLRSVLRIEQPAGAHLGPSLEPLRCARAWPFR